MEMKEFVAYCMDFYGRGGIYDFGVVPEEIEEAVAKRIEMRPEMEFCGDSVDREMVRDIIIARRERFFDMRHEVAFV